MFGHKPAADGSPCPQMRSLLSQLSDGGLRGLARWYAEKHTKQCPRCTAALEGLVTLDARLHAHGVQLSTGAKGDELVIPPELRSRIESDMDRVDAVTNR